MDSNTYQGSGGFHRPGPSRSPRPSSRNRQHPYGLPGATRQISGSAPTMPGPAQYLHPSSAYTTPGTAMVPQQYYMPMTYTTTYQPGTITEYRAQPDSQGEACYNQPIPNYAEWDNMVEALDNPNNQSQALSHGNQHQVHAGLHDQPELSANAYINANGWSYPTAGFFAPLVPSVSDSIPRYDQMAGYSDQQAVPTYPEYLSSSVKYALQEQMVAAATTDRLSRDTDANASASSASPQKVFGATKSIYRFVAPNLLRYPRDHGYRMTREGDSNTFLLRKPGLSWKEIQAEQSKSTRAGGTSDLSKTPHPKVGEWSSELRVKSLPEARGNHLDFGTVDLQNGSSRDIHYIYDLFKTANAFRDPTRDGSVLFDISKDEYTMATSCDIDTKDYGKIPGTFRLILKISSFRPSDEEPDNESSDRVTGVHSHFPDKDHIQTNYYNYSQ